MKTDYGLEDEKLGVITKHMVTPPIPWMVRLFSEIHRLEAKADATT